MDYPGDLLATTTIESVIDGDTVRVELDGEEVTVRVLGIDTPEVEGYRDEECWGPEAAEYAGELLADQTVHVFTDPGHDEYDQYDRLLAYLVTDDNMNYSVQAVSDGMARYYHIPDNPVSLHNVLQAAEGAARSEELGLWGPPCYGETSADGAE